MSFFLPAFALVVGEEGGFSKDAHDAGNWTGGKAGVGTFRGTKYGISAAANPTLDIEALTLDQARQIYQARYWTPLELDTQPWSVAILLFDGAVNQGQNWAKTLPRDALKIAVLRALRYAKNPDFLLYGDGWMTRLFTIFKAAQVTP